MHPPLVAVEGEPELVQEIRAQQSMDAARGRRHIEDADLHPLDDGVAHAQHGQLHERDIELAAAHHRHLAPGALGGHRQAEPPGDRGRDDRGLRSGIDDQRDEVDAVEGDLHERDVLHDADRHARGRLQDHARRLGGRARRPPDGRAPADERGDDEGEGDAGHAWGILHEVHWVGWTPPRSSSRSTAAPRPRPW
jgi:hypothetical protein